MKLLKKYDKYKDKNKIAYIEKTTEINNKIFILKGKISGLEFKISFENQKQLNKNSKEVIMENSKENFTCINYMFKLAEKTQKADPITLGYWIFNYSMVIFRFIFNYEENMKLSFNKNNSPLSLFLQENLKQNEINFIRNSEQYKRVEQGLIKQKEKKELERIAEKQDKLAKQKRARTEQEQHKKEFETAKTNYILGIKISNDLFLELCKEYKINIPLRTLLWSKNSLHTISCNTYTWAKKNKNSKQSDVIYSYMNILKDEILSNLQPKFCFIQFAIYYLIATLKQPKQEQSKPDLSLIFDKVRYSADTTKQVYPLAIIPKKEELITVQKIFISSKVQPVIKKTSKSLSGNYIQTTITRFKSFNSAYKLKIFLSTIGNKNQSLKDCSLDLGLNFKVPAWIKTDEGDNAYFVYENCQYCYNYLDQRIVTYLLPEPKNVLLLPGPEAIQEQTTKQNKDHFADFEMLYFKKLHEKRTIRKQNSKTASIFNNIMRFSSIACLIMLFIHSFIMLEKSSTIFKNLTKKESVIKIDGEIAKQHIKTMPNLSDNTLSGTNYHFYNKTSKNSAFGGLNLISLVILISSIKRKVEKTGKYKFVIIVKCSNSNYWYKNLIGEVFLVDTELLPPPTTDSLEYYYKVVATQKGIRTCDCENC